MKHIFLPLFALSLCALPLSADEGMWMIQDTDKKTQEISKSIVSVDFMGTGSLISDKGLVITNHHVSYGDVFALSTPEKNLLRDGFWARSLQEEIPVPGRHMQILQETIDVTDEVNALIESGKVKKGPMMMRRLGGMMEKKYEEKTGLAASLGSFWRGEKYYVSLYREYRDIRLVAAPPESIGSYGGDVDNWEWPQHKGDFALYRIYTAPDGSPADYSENNVPLGSVQHLKICTKGCREGQKTVVVGFPGRTDRYASSAKVNYQMNVTLPVSTEVRAGQMAIIKKWMDRDEAVKLKYSDHFFGLSNAQELYLGQLQCYKRFDVVGEKQQKEAELNAWIAADPARKEQWDTLTKELQDKYAAIAAAEKDLAVYRECLPRGTTRLSAIVSRTAVLANKVTEERIASTRRAGEKNYAEMDMRVEKELFRYTLGYYYDNLRPERLGAFQKELKERFGDDYDAMCAYLWDGSLFTREEAIAHYLDESSDMAADLPSYLQDPLLRFLQDVRIADFNAEVDAAQGKPTVSDLGAEYTHAMYKMALDKKQKLYPDANSTLRASFGKVCDLSPRDAVHCDWYSTVQGLKEKYDPSDIDYYMKPEYAALLGTADPKMKINFLSDNDITGGNSGSPIMNMNGEVLGLVFDGNKESLASDTSFTADYNRSVSVDIRYVIWILRNYARLDNILEEIGL